MIGQGQSTRTTAADLESGQEPSRPIRFIEDTPPGGSPVVATPVEAPADGELKEGVSRIAIDDSSGLKVEGIDADRAVGRN